MDKEGLLLNKVLGLGLVIQDAKVHVYDAIAAARLRLVAEKEKEQVMLCIVSLFVHD